MPPRRPSSVADYASLAQSQDGLDTIVKNARSRESSFHFEFGTASLGRPVKRRPKEKARKEGDTSKSSADTRRRVSVPDFQRSLAPFVEKQQELLRRVQDMERTQERLASQSRGAERDQAGNTLRKERNYFTNKIQKLQMQCRDLQESAMIIERNIRMFNLQARGFSGDELNSSCKFDTFMKDKLHLQSLILENARRAGHDGKSSPRHVIVKFLQRSQVQQSLDRSKVALREPGVFILRDLPPADSARRRVFKDFMDCLYSPDMGREFGKRNCLWIARYTRSEFFIGLFVYAC